jgi:Fic family protein
MYSTKPPFEITNKILTLLQNIYYELGSLAGAKLTSQPVFLRKDNQVNTIYSSLAIEGNSLTIDQVSGIIEGKRVLGSQKDICEVNNAIKLYANLAELNPLSIDSLLYAHELLMQGLITDNGQWRRGKVAIFKGNQITHFAPPASRLQGLMSDLFRFINQYSDISWIIKALVFHCELEFIHPFSDGNGRMGRLWQQLLLMQENKIFEYISVEALIKENQQEYYNSLAQCDKLGNSTLFIEFMGALVLDTLKQYNANSKPSVSTVISRIEFAGIKLENKWFTRKDYLLEHKDISGATASRDLAFGLHQGLLIRKGVKNQTYYRFV